MLGGVSPGTKKRITELYVNKHLDFCAKEGIQNWIQIDKGHVERYGAHLKKRAYADRSIYLEFVLVKSVMKWLIGKRLVPESCRSSHLSCGNPREATHTATRRNKCVVMLDHCQKPYRA